MWKVSLNKWNQFMYQTKHFKYSDFILCLIIIKRQFDWGPHCCWEMIIGKNHSTYVVKNMTLINNNKKSELTYECVLRTSNQQLTVHNVRNLTLMRKRRGMYELFSLYQFQLQLAIIMKSHIIFFSIVEIIHKRSNQRHIINQNITNCAHQNMVHNTNVWNVELAIIFQVSLPVHVQNMQFTKVCYLIVVGTGFFPF